MENNNNSNPVKKNKYLSIGISVFIVIITIVFFYILMFGNKKEKQDEEKQNQTAQQQNTNLSNEQRLVNALETVKTDSSENSLFALGLAYVDNKMYKESIVIYLKVLKINPNNAIANNNIGFAYGCINDWDNGVKYCQKAIDLDNNFQLAKNNLKWMQDEKNKADSK